MRLKKINTIIYLALAVVFFCVQGYAYAGTCIGCHDNPLYEKADALRLNECLQCHGRAEHPYKESLLSGKLAYAEAVPEGTAKGLDEKQLEADLSGMVHIKAGEFMMGSDDRLRDEKPAHVVYVDEFYIDIYEVTKSDYKKFIDATGRTAPEAWEGGSYPEGKSEHPMTYVTWNDADDYCRWQGKRLPSEREWEKAARGTDGRVYPWGNKWDLNKSNNPLRAIEATMPVGSFEEGKNQNGLYDMSGNVWEWVDDVYLPHPGSDYVNIEFGDHYKILKGGSWWDCMFYGCGISAPTYNRAFFAPSTISDSYGFRCAADKPEAK
jgi:iron(II)-dependent oxidoreductase